MRSKNEKKSQQSVILRAWDRQLKKSDNNPEIVHSLYGKKKAIIQRFYNFYHHLSSLPQKMRQPIQLKPSLTICGLVFLMAVNADHVKAADINVDGTCSLIDAINAANSDSPSGGCPSGSGADDINLLPYNIFEVHEINNVDPVSGPRGMPAVTSEITINGNGSTVTRSSGSEDPVGLIKVESGGNLTVKELSIVGFVGPDGAAVYVDDNGSLTVSDTVFSGNQTSGTGGAIYNNGGLVEINDSEFDSNFATEGGSAITNKNGGEVDITKTDISGNASMIDGASLLNEGVGSTMDIEESNLTGNSSTFGAGGIFNAFGATLGVIGSNISENTLDEGTGGGAITNSATATISGTTFIGNTAQSGAGAICNMDGMLWVDSSLFDENSTDSGGGALGNYGSSSSLDLEDDIIRGSSVRQGGGGLMNDGGEATIENTTFSGNSTTSSGGGGVNNGGQGTVFIHNCTLSENTSAEYGGGINTDEAVTVINDSTLSGNNALYGGGVSVRIRGTVFFGRNIISGNFADSAVYGHEINIYYMKVVATSEGYNIFGTDNDAGIVGLFSPGILDFVPPPGVLIDDIIGPLADNGGFTDTHALVPGSPALDLIPVSDPGCTDTDQRGVSRPQGPGCDAGSFEKQQKTCDGDFDGDGDQDGADVVQLALDTSLLPMADFVRDFGSDDCSTPMPEQ